MTLRMGPALAGLLRSRPFCQVTAWHYHAFAVADESYDAIADRLWAVCPVALGGAYKIVSRAVLARTQYP